MDQKRSRPLSYDALKSVLKSMSVEKRQEVHNYLPSLRAVNSALPHTIKSVRIMPNSIKINKKLWVFSRNPKRSNSDYDGLKKTTISIIDLDSDQRSPDFTVNKSFHEAFEKCFNVYLKNGSTIQEFDLCDVPKFLCERDGSDGLKWDISRLITDNGIILDKINSFFRFVNLDKLERMSLTFYDQQQGERLGMLKMPVIINCKNLDLAGLFVPESSIKYLTGLRNQALILKDNSFSVDDLRKLIENWKISDRPIGTGFYLYPYSNDTNDMISPLNLEDTFPVDIERDSTRIQGIGIKMDNNRDLVLYHGQHLIGSWYYQALKMEVIASGSEKKNGDSEPHVSA